MYRIQIIDHLDHFLNREAHSLSSYVLEAEPFVEPDQTFALKELRSVAERERRRADDLRQLLRDHLRAAPADRHFPPVVADMNYLSLTYLLTLIVRDKSALVDEYDTFLALTGGLADWATARDGAAKAAEGARYDLEHLRSLLSRLIAAKANGKMQKAASQEAVAAAQE